MGVVLSDRSGRKWNSNYHWWHPVCAIWATTEPRIVEDGTLRSMDQGSCWNDEDRPLPITPDQARQLAARLEEHRGVLLPLLIERTDTAAGAEQKLQRLLTFLRECDGFEVN